MMAIWILIGLFSAGYIGYVAGSRPWRVKYGNLRKAAQRAMQVLGPNAVCECAGCAWETDEAIRLLNEAGISYISRRRPVPPHDPEAERRGNEFVNDGTHQSSH